MRLKLSGVALAALGWALGGGCSRAGSSVQAVGLGCVPCVAQHCRDDSRGLEGKKRMEFLMYIL